jgi:type II secretory pathway component PulF
MPTFSYRAVSAKGETQTGVMEAPDRKGVHQRLTARQLRPMEITAKDGEATAAAALTASMDNSAAKSAAATTKAAAKAVPVRSAAAAKAGLSKAASSRAAAAKLLGPEDFKGEKVALAFLKKLFQLHSGGMPLGDAIRLLSIRVTDPQQASLAARIWKDISEGRTLANAMRGYPKSFDTSSIHLIEAGESTGNLAPVVENLIQHLEEKAVLRKKILHGLAYPAFICALAFGVVLLFLFFLLPRIRLMMQSMGGKMTFMTSLLIGTSEFGVKWGWIFVLLGFGAALYIWHIRKKPAGRAQTDSWSLRLPFLKYIFINSDICRVSNLCATLLESGVNTTEALRMTEKAINNTIIQSRFAAARSLINDGASFSNSFKLHHVLPDLDLDLLAVGENTGNIAKSFREIYRNHTIELTDQFEKLTVIIAGGALGFAFLMVAVLALSIVTSVFAMANSLTGAGHR